MSVEDLVNQITDQNFKTAEVTLNDLLADRMNAALEQEKIAVANQIYNGAEEDDEEQLEMDFDEDEDDFEDAEEESDDDEESDED